MPGWIWPILVLCMIASCIAGLIYALRKAARTARVAGSLAGQVQAKLNQNYPEDGEQVPSVPAFTQPIAASSQRYAEAHARVIERKEQARNKHRQQWQVWRNFNE